MNAPFYTAMARVVDEAMGRLTAHGIPSTPLLDALGRRNVRKHADRACAQCHALFWPANDTTKYCGNLCANVAKRIEGKTKTESITVDANYVRAMFAYDQDSGELTRRVANGKREGTPVGHAGTGGYLRTNIAGRAYSVHRLIWLHVYGEWPTHNIDHINGDPADNRITNLRDVPQRVNVQNIRTATKNNKTGFLGVSRYRGRYRATIYSGRQITIGYFDNAAEAHDAYLQAKRRIHEGGTI